MVSLMPVVLHVLVTSFFHFALSKDKKSPPCFICRELTAAFNKGLHDTSSDNYQGGTSYSARDSLTPYKDSELRFVEIVEKICSSAMDKQKCSSFLEKHEEALEHWFYSLKKEVDLFSHLCIKTTKVCCPENHYGKNCEVCPGLVGGIMCYGRGKCSGEGSIKGNGSCICDAGYTGPNCDECSLLYYRNDKEECLSCHYACASTCVNETVEGCVGDCKEGWIKDKNGLCIDVDECYLATHNCKSTQRCLNVPGRFYCRDCYKSCQTCDGPEENKCLTCKPGYVKTEDARCIDIDECLDGSHRCKELTYCVNKDGGYNCKKCHKACLKGCIGPLIEDCQECREGYQTKTDGSGCVDIDECDEGLKCPEGKYCSNKPGTYKCKACDRACHVCHGPGPDSCYSCAQSFVLLDGVCKDPSSIKHVEDSEEEDDL